MENVMLNFTAAALLTSIFVNLNKIGSVWEMKHFWWYNKCSYGTHKIKHNVSIHGNHGNNGESSKHLGNKGNHSNVSNQISKTFT